MSYVLIGQICFVCRTEEPIGLMMRAMAGRRTESQSEGLLGRIVVEGGGNMRSLF